MEISINVSKLKRHLSHLREESDEVKVLFHLLDDWEQSGLDDNGYFFSGQRTLLEKQREMIHERIKVLEALIDEFSRCIYTIDNALQNSNNELDVVDAPDALN